MEGDKHMKGFAGLSSLVSTITPSHSSGPAIKKTPSAKPAYVPQQLSPREGFESTDEEASYELHWRAQNVLGVIVAVALLVVSFMVLSSKETNHGNSGGMETELGPTPAPSHSTATSKNDAREILPVLAVEDDANARNSGSSGIHRVVSGETLAKIADKYGVTLQAILAVNPAIKSADRILVGQAVTIPAMEPKKYALDHVSTKRSETGGTPSTSPPAIVATTGTMPQKLPQNGFVKRYHSTKAVAPLTIMTQGAGQNYFVKMTDWVTGVTVVTVFIHGGRSVDIEMPLGSYKMKYASGVTWYGERDLFGEETDFSMADSRFDFEITGNQVSGYSVELYLQANGNLETRDIPRSAF